VLWRLRDQPGQANLAGFAPQPTTRSAALGDAGSGSLHRPEVAAGTGSGRSPAAVVEPGSAAADASMGDIAEGGPWEDRGLSDAEAGGEESMMGDQEEEAFWNKDAGNEGHKAASGVNRGLEAGVPDTPEAEAGADGGVGRLHRVTRAQVAQSRENGGENGGKNAAEGWQNSTDAACESEARETPGGGAGAQAAPQQTAKESGENLRFHAW